MSINTEVCTNCGLCLSVCPIYRITLNERYSPRGKINLYNYSVKTGDYSDPSIREAFFKCVFCGRCQKICPAGINILGIITDFKNKIAKQNALLQNLLPTLFTGKTIINLISTLISIKDLNLPTGKIVSSYPEKRTYIFAGCYYRSIGIKNLKILLKSIPNTFYSNKQVCCGLPLLGTNREEQIIKLIHSNLSLISKFSPDIIITLCDSCHFVIDKIWKEFINDSLKTYLNNKIMRLSDFISPQLILDSDLSGRNIYYHRSCHDLGNFSIEKLEKYLQKEIVKLPDGCCGFGGFFSLKYKDESRNLFNRLTKDVEFKKRDIVLTTCSGCEYQFRRNLKRRGVKVIHPLLLGISD